MKSKKLMCLTAMALLTVLAIPVQLAAQDNQHHPHQLHRCQLVDLGTLGGPNSFVNGPTVPDLSNIGIYDGEAETSIPDPYAPNCFNSECLIEQATERRNSVATDLGALPGVNNSFTTWISANGRFISRGSENGLIDPLLGVPEFQAVVWKHGQINNLGTLDGGHKSLATAANSRGQVSGLFNNLIPGPFSMFCLLVCSTTQIRAFLWQAESCRIWEP